VALVGRPSTYRGWWGDVRRRPERRSRGAVGGGNDRRARL